MTPKTTQQTAHKEEELQPVQRRLLIPLTMILLLLVAGFGALLTTQYRDHQHQSSKNLLSESVEELAETLEEQSAMLAALEDVILRDEGLRSSLAVGDRECLLADWQPTYEKLRQAHGVTHFYFHGPDRVNLLRVHNPQKNSDLIGRFTALEAERTGKTASGIELGRLGTFTLRVVRPVFDGETLLGYLELGKEIEDALSGIHAKHHVELAVAIHKSALNRKKWESGMKMLGRDGDWDRYGGSVLIYSSLNPLPAACDRFIEETGQSEHEHGNTGVRAEFGNKQWGVLVSPLQDVSGSVVGDLIILQDVSAEAAAFRQLLAVAIPAVLLVLTGVTAFLFFVLRRTDAGIRNQQQELLESTERFEQLAEQSRTFTWEVDANGLYTYVSHTVASVLGYKPEELVGKMHFYDLHPEIGRDAFKTAALEVFAGKEYFHDLENQVETKAGQHIWLSTNGIPVLDENGNLTGYRGNDMDITHRKQAQKKLRTQKERLNNILEGTNVGTWEWNVQTGETIFNEKWANIIGYTLDEISPVSIDTWLKLVHPDDLKKSGELLEKHFKGDLDYYHFESRMKHKDGSWIWILDRGKVITWDEDGKPLWIFGTHQDITDHKQAQDEFQCTLAETERLNQLMSGREDRVLELKDEVNVLLSELGRKTKYGRNYT